MKILYHHRIASKDGQYVHVEEIINALRHLGHEVVVVAPGVAQYSQFGSEGGWVTDLKKRLPQFIYELLEFAYSFYAFFKLLIAVLVHKPDVIYERCNLFLPSGIWTKKLFGLPLLLEVNAPLYQERKQYGGITLDSLAKWAERYAWCNADYVLPVTDVMAGYLRDEGVPESRILVVPNGVDRHKFAPRSERQRDPEFAGKLVIGFVGFCREWHRLDEVLSLIAEENNLDLYLLIVGDGPVINALQLQAKQLGLEQRFKVSGLVEREEMPYWLEQIDIALQPAVTPWASPLKMIEYLAKETAIVAPDTDNIKELLDHGDNALLFDHRDITSMMGPIKQLIEDPELRRRLSINAGQTIDNKQLLWTHNAQRILAAFEQLLAGK